jgi:hypothetical protein
LEPHRLIATDGILAVCATCKKDLRDCDVASASSAIIEFQKVANNLSMGACWGNGGVSLPGWCWFDGVHEMIGLIRQGSFEKSQSLHRKLSDAGVSKRWESCSTTGLAFELLPVEQRTILLEDAFIAINSAGRWTKKGFDASAFHDEMVVRKGYPGVRARAGNVLRKNNPISPKAVRKMYERLIRRMRGQK